MKKILLFVFCLANLNVSECLENWPKIIEPEKKKQIIQEEIFYDTAVKKMEDEQIIDHPELYVQRAGIKALLGKLEQAISDLGKAIQSNNLTEEDRIEAFALRAILNFSLGNKEAYRIDWETYKKLDTAKCQRQSA